MHVEPISAQPNGAVIGLFDDADALRRAAERARAAQWPHWDCHSPYPVAGLDAAMGLRPSWIPGLALAAGFTGVAVAKLMQWYMSDFDYPLIVGGKPLFSLPAFLPVTFELFVLFGAGTTFAALLAACRLLRWRSSLHDVSAMADATSHRFAIVLQTDRDDRFSGQTARDLLLECGCADIRIAHEAP